MRAGRRGDVSRRSFIRMGVVGTAMASAALMDRDRSAGAALMGSSSQTTAPRGGIGLVPAGPELALPPGFSYHTFGAFGSAMSDGFITPPIHDGMAAFASGGGTIRLVRNHELGEGNDIPAGTVIGVPNTAYDRKAPGGTTTLVIDATTAELLDSFISLNGTDTNCARHADAVGHLAHVRGDRRRRQLGPAPAAWLRLRGRPARRPARSSPSRTGRWAASCTRPAPSIPTPASST